MLFFLLFKIEISKKKIGFIHPILYFNIPTGQPMDFIVTDIYNIHQGLNSKFVCIVLHLTQTNLQYNLIRLSIL